MENGNNHRKQPDSVYSTKIRAGKRRTYFFDVKQTKGDDFYVTITESTRRFDGDGYERHKIFLYKEDFNRFVGGLEEVVNKIKEEYLPDYDYEEFERRQEEWETNNKLNEEFATEDGNSNGQKKSTNSEDDISW